MLVFDTFGLLVIRPLVIVRHLVPHLPQPDADLWVVRVRELWREVRSVVTCPHHERVHWSLHVAALVDIVGARGPVDHVRTCHSKRTVWSCGQQTLCLRLPLCKSNLIMYGKFKGDLTTQNEININWFSGYVTDGLFVNSVRSDFVLAHFTLSGCVVHAIHHWSHFR